MKYQNPFVVPICGALCRAFVAALLLLTPLAWGHGVELFATVEGNQIHGSVRYADHTPVDDAPVRAYAPDGAMIAETRTGPDGRFTLPVTQHTDYRIVGDAGEGHLGEHTVRAAELPLTAETANSPEAIGSDDVVSSPSHTMHELVHDDLDARIEQAVARQVAPLRQQLFDYEHTLRLRDILGGIGYVFGLAGVVAMLKRRKSPES